MNSAVSTLRIAGMGEILWDVFPDGERLGGAPTNFACHCHQMGAQAYPVGCVGDDTLGQRTLAVLADRGVEVGFVQQSAAYPTGRVRVALDAAGKPSYEILENAAWDHLAVTPELEALAPSLHAACFGVLAQRSAESRQAIHHVLGAMPKGSLRILDVNLRKPFYTREAVHASLARASVLKLSDEELPVLAGWFGLQGSATQQLGALRKQHGLDLVAYTRGRDGSVLVSDQETVETPGRQVVAVDTVGAGDAFTAALCMGLLRGWPLPKIGRCANDVAAFVCSQQGATPTLPDRLIREHFCS